jgi:hypothetical protein
VINVYWRDGLTGKMAPEKSESQGISD